MDMGVQRERETRHYPIRLLKAIQARKQRKREKRKKKRERTEPESATDKRQREASIYGW